MSLETCLESIKDCGDLPDDTEFYNLSDLSARQTSTFNSVWRQVVPFRKLNILSKLVELSHDNTKLDFNTVFRHCLSEPDEDVVCKALQGLWESEERNLISPLCHLTNRGSSIKVRAAAATALEKFATLAMERKLIRKDHIRVQECLISTLENTYEHVDVRRRALESISVLNTEQVNEFIEWAYNSDDPDLKSSALYAMGKTGESTWLVRLVKEFKSPIPILRYEAANACGALEEENAIPHLTSLIDQDDDIEIQLSAIRAIGTIGGPLAKKALRRCMKSRDPMIEETASEYLELVRSFEDDQNPHY